MNLCGACLEVDFCPPLYFKSIVSSIRASITSTFDVLTFQNFTWTLVIYRTRQLKIWRECTLFGARPVQLHTRDDNTSYAFDLGVALSLPWTPLLVSLRGSSNHALSLIRSEHFPNAAGWAMVTNRVIGF